MSMDKKLSIEQQYRKSPCALRTAIALNVLVQSNNVFEIRIPKARKVGTVAGYFNDTAIAGRICEKWNMEAAGIYVTLNPVNPILLARASNRVIERAETTTTDSDIIRRVWFPLDFDPKRPSGLSSSEEEHAAAARRAADVRDWLTTLGWPLPIEANSGNGAHLLYRIDLPNDPESTRLIGDAIRSISAVWSDDIVNVDETVFNAARIWKIYGTVSAKGDNTEDRPWRISELLTVPDPIVIVDRTKLDALALPMRTEREDATHPKTGNRILDIAAYVQELGCRVIAGPMSLFGKGQKWVLDECVFNPDHKKPIIGIIEGKPIYKCLHNSCQHNGWRQFREKKDPGYASPELIAQRMIDGDAHSDEWVEPLARLSEKGYQVVRMKLKDAGVKDLRAIDKAVQLERSRKIEADAAESGTPGNIYGLALQIRQLQGEGVLPTVWHNSLDDSRWVGEGQYATQFREEWHSGRTVIEFHKRGIKWVSRSTVGQAYDFIVYDNGLRNPLREWLESTIWDRTPRLNTWLIDYMNVDDDAKGYARAVGRKWLISAVARIMRPGCQADHMLILEGMQGIGKSQALRVLGGDYYAEFGGQLIAVGDHGRLVEAILGKSIVEMAELSSFKKTSIEALKHGLTVTTDRVRLAYRKDAVNYPRTVVFAGTTNAIDERYIADNTGARRFWPVRCWGSVRVEELARIREQLWAEALVAYHAGEDWWMVPEEAAKEQQSHRMSRVEDTAAYQKILTEILNDDNWVEGLLKVTVNGSGEFRLTCRLQAVEIMAIWLDMSMSQVVGDQRMMQIIASVMKALGFKSQKIGGKPVYVMDDESIAQPDIWARAQAEIKRVSQSAHPN